MNATSSTAASFRDPAGRLHHQGGRLLRTVTPEGADCARLFIDSPAFTQFRDAGQFVDTRVLGHDEAEAAGLGDCALALEHEPLFFPSYPAEWPAEMLVNAAELTLNVMESALCAGAGLKDATPYNVLFDGPRAVFADALSIEPRHVRDPLWRAAAQFERTFLYPLAALRCGIPLSLALALRRDGPEPAELSDWAGPLRRWLPPFLTLATLPARLGGARRVADDAFYRPRQAASAEQARFILERSVAGLRSRLRRLAPKPSSSTWANYQEADCHYSATDLETKDRFVQEALARLRPGSNVLDLGANLGRYSRMAAQMGHRVVAVDADPVVMGRLFEAARAAGENILPLIVDLSNPTAGSGWNNAETRSFLERAEGRFDCVLMLAVVHHMMVTHGVPLSEIVGFAARLTRGTVVAEYVGPQDAMFRRLVRGRDALYSGYNEDAFSAAWLERGCRLSRMVLQNSKRILHEISMTR